MHFFALSICLLLPNLSNLYYPCCCVIFFGLLPFAASCSKFSKKHWCYIELLLRNSSLHYVLNKILYNGKAFSGYQCFGGFWSANNWPWPWPCTTDLIVSYLPTKWQLWQLTFKWLSGGCGQDKSKQYYCCFFFPQNFIQLCNSRKIHYLTSEFHVKLHLKTDIALIASWFVWYQFSRAI